MVNIILMITMYRHTQSGRAFIYPLAAIALAATIVAMIFPESRAVGAIVAAILFVTAVVFSKLTITIDDDYLRASFGPGFVGKRIKLTDIAACEPIRIRWWHGWGIHLTPYGWLYNVAGWDAVAVTLRNGRRVSLGTDQPAELCDAIRRVASANMQPGAGK
jgi:hypothetical protein